MKKAAKGFTLVEIMIVVAIIGLLIAIALPSFMKARKKSVFTTAQASMKQIESNVENAKIDGVAVTFTEAGVTEALVPDYIKTWPACPGGGTWTFTAGSGTTGDTLTATIDGTTFDSATTLATYLGE